MSALYGNWFWECRGYNAMRPDKWSGERWWIVALIGEVQGDEEKYGALEREIIGECL